MSKLTVLNQDIAHYAQDDDDYISLTDIARYKDNARTDYLISNWMRNRNTIEFLGIWEQLNNPKFNPIEFDGIRKQTGLNSFILTSKQWAEKTGAIGLVPKVSGGLRVEWHGRLAHGRRTAPQSHSTHGRVAHATRPQPIRRTRRGIKPVANKIKEFQRLKADERKTLGWDIRRNLARINYRIHTDAIQTHLIPAKLTPSQISQIYASEADVLNLALFGKTAAQWRTAHPGKKGNMRDEADVSQLVCLSNLENLNALFISSRKKSA